MVQFQPIPALLSAHLGAFWKTLGPEWPHLSEAPPLEPQFERFGESQMWESPQLRFRLVAEPMVRLQIRSSTRDRMIQIQNGRFIYNWLGEAGGTYPTYAKVKPEFDRWLAAFKSFIVHERLDAVRPNQWEATYVNQMPIGTVWNECGDWENLLNGLISSPKDLDGLELETIGSEWRYEIKPMKGRRLYVSLQHGKRGNGDGGRESLVLTLTTRGPIEDQGGGLNAGLDLGTDRSYKASRVLLRRLQRRTGLSDADLRA